MTSNTTFEIYICDVGSENTIYERITQNSRCMQPVLLSLWNALGYQRRPAAAVEAFTIMPPVYPDIKASSSHFYFPVRRVLSTAVPRRSTSTVAASFCTTGHCSTRSCSARRRQLLHGMLRLSVVVLAFAAAGGYSFVGNMLGGRGVLRGAQRARSLVGEYTSTILPRCRSRLRTTTTGLNTCTGINAPRLAVEDAVMSCLAIDECRYILPRGRSTGCDGVERGTC